MDAKNLVNILSEAEVIPSSPRKDNRPSRDTVEAGYRKVAGVKSAGRTLNNAFGRIANVRKTVGRVTKDTLLQFPLLASTSLSEETLVILNKALEHEYVSLILLALNSILVNEVKANDTVGDILKRIHTNVDVSGKDILGDYARATGADSIAVSEALVENVFVESISIEDTTYEELNRLNEQSVLYPIGETLNNSILNHMSIPDVILQEAKGERTDNDREFPLDRNSDNPRSAYKNKVTLGDKGYSAHNRKNPNGSGKPSDGEIKNIDYKKLNMNAPTIVKCKVAITMVSNKGQGEDETRSEMTYVDLLFGVKTVLHPIESDMYVDELNEIFVTNKFPVRLVKWLTGEMKTRDFFLNASAAKKRALKTYGKNAEANNFWWTKLRELAKADRAIRTSDSATAIFNSGRGRVGDTGYLSAVTTMIISKSEAMRVKNKLGQNMLSRPNILDDIFEHLFIMNFIIVDEAGKVVYTYDLDRHSLTYTSLNALKLVAKDEIHVNGESIFAR